MNIKKLLPSGVTLMVAAFVIFSGWLMYGAPYPENWPMANIFRPLTIQYPITSSIIYLTMIAGFISAIGGFVITAISYEKWRTNK